MTKTKRFLAFSSLSVTLLIPLSACGGSSPSDNAPVVSKPQNTTTITKSNIDGSDYKTQCDGTNMIYILEGVGYGDAISVVKDDPRCVKEVEDSKR